MFAKPYPLALTTLPSCTTASERPGMCCSRICASMYSSTLSACADETTPDSRRATQIMLVMSNLISSFSFLYPELGTVFLVERRTVWRFNQEKQRLKDKVPPLVCFTS